MMLQSKAKLIKNIEVAKKYYKIIFSWPRITKIAKPGQFLQIKVSDDYEPFLRRPFSIHKISNALCAMRYASKTKKLYDRIEILYEMVGKGTWILSQRKAGEYLDVIGPLGNGFNLQPTTYNPQPILVAGGMGVAPLVFLAQRQWERKTQDAKRKTLILIGAKTKNQILCEKEFKRLGCDVKIATDDGSQGFKGKVTDLLKKFLPKNQRTKEPKNQIYACGPRPMLKEITEISKAYNIPAQISLEEHMACGIGACLGCVIKIKNQKSKIKNDFLYKRVCFDGPVFEAKEVLW